MRNAPQFALLLFCMLLSAVSLQAQTELNRISATERSDGNGFVVRYHLSQPADSFRVLQPAPDRIQMILYSGDLDTVSLQLPDEPELFDNLALYRTGSGYGVDFRLADGNHFRTNAYPDQNGRDLLLALTRTDLRELEHISEGISPIDWSRLTDSNADETDEYIFTSIMDDEAYSRIHSNLNFDTVVIDAGHGGHDPGSRGHNGVWEKEINLAIALKVGSYIEEHLPEIRVVYTRKDDTFLDLEERGRIANRERGDLFVSIHGNSVDTRNAYGSEVYFLGLARSASALDVMKRENSVVHLESGNGIEELSEEDLLIYELANAGNIAISEQIAEKIEHQFRARAQRRSRGVKQAQFVVLYHASMPAVLVEAGFISNPSEAQYLSTDYGQSIIASAIFRAIRDYKEEYERSRILTRSN